MSESTPPPATEPAAAAPAEPVGKKKAWYKRWWGITLIVVVALFVIGAIFSDDPESTAADPEAPAQTPAAEEPSEEPDPEPETPRKPAERVGDAIEGLSGVKGVAFDPNYTGNRQYIVRFDIADNLTKGMIRSGADNDVKKILEAVHDADPEARSVGVRGEFPLVDQYGNEFVGQVLWVHLDGATLRRINWDNALMIELENVADVYALHQTMR